MLQEILGRCRYRYQKRCGRDVRQLVTCISSSTLALDDLETDYEHDFLGGTPYRRRVELGTEPTCPRVSQRRHGRHGKAQQVEVVEAGDGDTTGHRPAAALAFEQRADGQHVAGEEAGIDVGMGLDQATMESAPSLSRGSSRTRAGSACSRDPSAPRVAATALRARSLSRSGRVTKPILDSSGSRDARSSRAPASKIE